jgi:hypothetical protein
LFSAQVSANVSGSLPKHCCCRKTVVEISPDGAALTREEASTSYLVIRHNVRTYQSAGVVEVIKGKQNAETAVKKYEVGQASSDRHEGWRYFLEKTEMKAGTDPTEATHRRQAELDNRETKEQLDTDALVDRQKASR